jgi:hypothetical protein
MIMSLIDARLRTPAPHLHNQYRTRRHAQAERSTDD